MIKMLKIIITPTTLVFCELSDLLYKKLTNEYNLKLEFVKDDYQIKADTKKLYKILLTLSNDFDIELI